MAERVFVALDLETTGLNASQDHIIEIGAVRMERGAITARFSTLVNPQRKIPLMVQQITGIRNDHVADAPLLANVLPELLSFVGPDVSAIVAHNAGFDLGFLRAAGIDFRRPALDTVMLAGILLPGQASYSLGELCRTLRIGLDDAHRALDDAEATAELFLILRDLVHGLPVPMLETLRDAAGESSWAPLLLIEEALAAETRAGRGVQRVPRVDTEAYRSQPHPLPDVPETLVKDGGPPAEPVDPAAMERLFGANGGLARQFGATYEDRPGQLEMARLVLAALNEGNHQMVEAGTGVGKSLGYLLPAALWSLQNQRRVIIATNTIALQDQLLDNDIPQLQALLTAEGYGALSASLLKGRQHYLCTRRLREWHRDRTLSEVELTVLAKVLVWLPTTATGDVSELFMLHGEERAIWRRITSDATTCHPGACSAKRGERDFYLEARRRAEHAHLLIVNHALLVADVGTDHSTLPAYTHLIIDEAHHLEDVATDQLTYRADWRSAQEMLYRLTLSGDVTASILAAGIQTRDRTIQEVCATIASQAQRAARALNRFADQLRHFALNHTDVRTDRTYVQRLALDGRMRTQPMWSQMEIEWDHTSRHLTGLCTEIDSLVAYLTTRHWQQQDPEALLLAETAGLGRELRELLVQLNSMVLQSATEREIVAWLEYDGDDRHNQQTSVQLAAAPLYVGDMISRRLLSELRTVVLTGATLRTGADFRFIRERLGLWGVDAAMVDSPFNYRDSTLLCLPADMPPPNTSQYQQALERAVIDAASAAQGRTMVLFTSYAHLRTTAEAIRGPLDQLHIAVLQHGTSSRRRLLREYRESDRAVLLGTRSFWEGIDLPGDQLSVLFIVKLPFAVPSDPLVAARSAEFENSFSEYTLPDAILRFRQGFGRLIRRASDRGVVILLDSRLWQKRYGQAFLEALPECSISRAKLGTLGNEVDLWLNRPRDRS